MKHSSKRWRRMKKKTAEDIEQQKKDNVEALATWIEETKQAAKDEEEGDPDRPVLEDMLEAEKAVIRT